MMNISFSATIDKFRQRRKHVTRRLGWQNLKPGDRLMGCEKVQGIKKGGLVRMGEIKILEVDREPLKDITRYSCRVIPEQITKYYALTPYLPSEMTLEGFPELSSVEFIKMFCKINKKCTPDTEITRILFDYGVM